MVVRELTPGVALSLAVAIGSSFGPLANEPPVALLSLRHVALVFEPHSLAVVVV
jgi:hypothetical protein